MAFDNRLCYCDAAVGCNAYFLETWGKDEVPVCQTVHRECIDSSYGWAGDVCEYTGFGNGREPFGKQVGVWLGSVVYG